MSTMRIFAGNCEECGKELFLNDDYRRFNDGKIIRCESCCQKLGIAKVELKKFTFVIK